MTVRRTLLAGTALLLAAAGLGGCGGEPPSPSPTLTTSTVSPSSSASTTSASPSATPSQVTPSPTLTGFGTEPVTGGTSGTVAGISRVAVGRHDGYDRFVVEVTGDAVPTYEVTPQDSPVFVLDPRGDEVRLDGQRGVLVVLRDIDVMRIPYDVDSTPGYPAIREVRLTGAFEGVVAYGLGVDGSGAVRVSTLRSPARLVVDVLHP